MPIHVPLLAPEATVVVPFHQFSCPGVTKVTVREPVGSWHNFREYFPPSIGFEEVALMMKVEFWLRIKRCVFPEFQFTVYEAAAVDEAIRPANWALEMTVEVPMVKPQPKTPRVVEATLKLLEA